MKNQTGSQDKNSDIKVTSAGKKTKYTNKVFVYHRFDNELKNSNQKKN